LFKNRNHPSQCFYFCKLLPNFSLKKNDFDLCKGFFMEKNDQNVADFGNKKFESPNFYDKFQ
jgi:hypothetical protein